MEDAVNEEPILRDFDVALTKAEADLCRPDRHLRPNWCGGSSTGAGSGGAGRGSPFGAVGGGIDDAARHGIEPRLLALR